MTLNTCSTLLKDIPGSETLYLKADVEIGQSWGGGKNTWV